MPYNRISAIVGGKEKVVTSVDVYKEIRRLQIEGVTSQRAAAKRLGISRNTVKKYWEATPSHGTVRSIAEKRVS